MVVSYKSVICDFFGSESPLSRQSEGYSAELEINGTERSQQKNKYVVTCSGGTTTKHVNIPATYQTGVQEERVL